jgi:2-methylcitrate dehydratase PrpD
MINGYAAHLMEFDDATLNPVGHPSATVLPTVLALAEARGLRGPDIVAAYLVGLEVHARLGQAHSEGWPYAEPWVPIGTIGLMAATAAAARLLRLEPTVMENALGLASHFAGQLNVGNGSSAKPFGAGHSARCAVQAVELAEVGLSGPSQVLERRGGFAETFLGGAGDELETSLRRLGGPAHLAETGVAVKRYPNCYGVNWSVDALRALMDNRRIDADEIESVTLLYPKEAAFLDDPHPHTVEAARLSLQYGLAMCLINGYPKPNNFTDASVSDERVLATLVRVTAHQRPTDGVDERAHTVVVKLVDGTEHSNQVKWPHGHPRDPLTQREVEEKFFANASILPTASASAIVAAVLALEKLENLAAVVRLMVGGPG